jgi:hypothetical protein
MAQQLTFVPAFHSLSTDVSVRRSSTLQSSNERRPKVSKRLRRTADSIVETKSEGVVCWTIEMTEITNGPIFSLFVLNKKRREDDY